MKTFQAEGMEQKYSVNKSPKPPICLSDAGAATSFGFELAKASGTL